MKNNSLLKGNAIFEKYVRRNFIKYSIVLLIYIVGFIIGINIFNGEIQKEEGIDELTQYVIASVDSLNLKVNDAIANYIKEDFIFLFKLILLSFSLIGIPIIFVLLFTEAISLGVTVSALIYTNGVNFGLSFSILDFMIPSIIKIFIVLAMICSSFKFLENIFKYHKEMKYELVRHAIIILINFIAIGILALYRTFSLQVITSIS